MRPFSFTCKCQSKDIVTQYEKYGVRCFDLRLRYINGVAATGTFVKNSAAEWDVSGVNGIPEGWTVQTASA